MTTSTLPKTVEPAASEPEGKRMTTRSLLQNCRQAFPGVCLWN
jgi:hypothetical protein